MSPPAYRSWYEQSLRTFSQLIESAAIPVERITAELVLIAGEDDQVWPSSDWARLIKARRAEHGLPTMVITHPEAGHRVIFPGENPAQRGQSMERGGSDRTNAELGARAWPHLLQALRLNE